jgi:5-methylthioadenosine/S-adenosylhomocysteine deaminase
MTREAIDLLIEPRWLLPMSAGGDVRGGYALAVDAGRIRALGPAAELRTRFAAREELRRSAHALLPGLVNAHTHLCHTLLRGLPVHAPRARWLRETLAPALAAALSPDFVRDGTRLGIAEMLRAGITCFADLSPYPEEAARVAAQAPVRASIGLPISEAAGPWAEGLTAHLARAERLWDEYASDARIRLYFAPQSPGAASETLLTRVRRVADELEARVTLDLSDAAALGGEYEVRDGEGRPAADAAIARLATLGLLRQGTAAIVTHSLGAAALARLAHHGAGLIGCPQADLRLGETTPARLPAARAGLGSASPAATGALDLIAECRAAALAGAPALQALELATLGGARVLGLDEEIGSLEPGKAADFICVELDSLACRPEAGVAEALVFAATRDKVSDVWCAGRAAVSGGRLLAFDEAELAALPHAWRRRLKLEAAA